VGAAGSLTRPRGGWPSATSRAVTEYPLEELERTLAVVGLSRAAHSRRLRGYASTRAPGPTNTRIMEEIDAAITAQGGDPALFTDRVAMGRYGYPNETGQFAVWLLPTRRRI
jgi:NAD(P)-dependent dehydrogenase (short-subunit alcohol dehydrogenase family)